jgi:DNA-binding SARP family transcriptional activator
LDGLSQRVTTLREYFHGAGHYYDEALASLLSAEVLAAEGQEKDAVVNLNRVLDLSARFDYDYWLRREMRRVPELFLIEDIVERLPADLRNETGAPSSASPPVMSVSSPNTRSLIDLTVNLLGPVEVFRDPANPFAADAWTTRRARDIFCLIASSKYRRVAKDVLIDVFWSDDDPKAVEKNFHPTISHIRKALNSRQTLKQNFLVFRDGSYQLNPDLSYFIDVEEFDRLVSEAEAAKRDKDNDRLRASLEGAYCLYRGEFMPGVYEDWAEERRNYYSEQFGRITGALAKLSLAERRFTDGQRFAAEVLKLDPYREDMYRLTIKLLAAQGKKPAAKKHYEEMVKLFNSELGVSPSPETRKLAAELGL